MKLFERLKSFKKFLLEYFLSLIIVGSLTIGSIIILIPIRSLIDNGYGNLLIGLSISISGLVVYYNFRAIRRYSSVNKRIIIIVLNYLIFLVCYAGVYFIIFWSNPRSFCFSPNITQGEMVQGFNSNLEELEKCNKKIFLLGVLNSYPERGLTIVKNPIYSPIAILSYKKIAIDSIRSGAYIIHFSNSFIPSTSTLIIYEKGDEYKFGSLLLVDPEAGIVEGLENSNSIESFHQHLGNLISFYVKKRNNLIDRWDQLIKNKPYWSFWDFLYFSTITASTLGYGDIIPNSRSVRILVISQVILSITYIAFALSFGRVKK